VTSSCVKYRSFSLTVWSSLTGTEAHMSHPNYMQISLEKVLILFVRESGFGQDRVNFHQNPGRDTAGGADPTPTWPNRAGYSIPCAVTLGSGGGRGAAGELTRGSGARGGGSVRESGSVLLVCFVYSPFLYRCCSCSLCLLFC